jgi:hypothetical protein
MFVIRKHDQFSQKIATSEIKNQREGRQNFVNLTYSQHTAPHQDLCE